jgi:hypothetical protein
METLNGIVLTKKEIDNWLNKTDSDLNYETYECFISPDEITFQSFYDLYNEKHFEKFGHKILMQLE